MNIIEHYLKRKNTGQDTWFQAAPAQAQAWHKDIPLRLKLWKQSQCLEAWALGEIQEECVQLLIHKINMFGFQFCFDAKSGKQPSWRATEMCFK